MPSSTSIFSNRDLGELLAKAFGITRKSEKLQASDAEIPSAKNRSDFIVTSPIKSYAISSISWTACLAFKLIISKI